MFFIITQGARSGAILGFAKCNAVGAVGVRPAANAASASGGKIRHYPQHGRKPRSTAGVEAGQRPVDAA
jgi:hypothetical protein